MEIADLVVQFREKFKTTDNPRVFFAPGRINLIGEHTDYNGGHVFPAAISFGTYAVVRKRDDNILHFYSMNFPYDGIRKGDLKHTEYNKGDEWANFPKGMIDYLQQLTGKINTGLDILYYGNIPNGAGLSSSASIEMVTGILLNDIYQLQLDPIKIAKIGQKVENEYIGVSSGIMDQFAIMMGKKDHAIHLHTETLNYHYAPVKLTNHAIIMINTNKQRKLAESKYNERQFECRGALSQLQTKLTIEHLAQVTPAIFEQNKFLIKHPIHVKRAKHVIYENERTKLALTSLQNDDLEQFGQLMNESHESLQKDYEVTGVELDTIVHTAWKQEGVIGARMTGAGFGGCAIAIVANNFIEKFKVNVNQRYVETVGYDATFYTANIDHGAREIIDKFKAI